MYVPRDGPLVPCTKEACYVHMENGSIRVKTGDTIQEGQVIGLIGNSGNSDIPHLLISHYNPK